MNKLTLENNATFIIKQDDTDDNNKEETDDDNISESIEEMIKNENAKATKLSHPNTAEITNQKQIASSDRSKLENISIKSIDSTTKLHFKARSILEGITPKEQKEIAADMFSQMKQLKASNEVMGYHGFSGLLQRHDSNMNITGEYKPNDSNDQILNASNDESNTNEIKSNRDDDSNSSIDSYPESDIHPKTLNRTRNSHKNVTVSRAEKHLIMSETKPLREKLETISMSINKIRQDLVGNNSQNFNLFENISQKQLNETVMFFQNQLTDIQDQIEDAENDIESNIDLKLFQYSEEIKSNKLRIKNMKKHTKEQEKLLQLNKEKEQKKIIELQRMQIEQLIRCQSDKIKNHNYALTPPSPAPSPNHHFASQTMSNIKFHKNDYKMQPKRKRRHSATSLSVIDSDNDFDFKDIQIATNNNLNLNMNMNMNNNLNSPYMNDDMDDMDFPSPVTIPNTISQNNNNYLPNEGTQFLQFHSQCSQNGMMNHRQKQQPLLSDNAIKIIGGVAIFLSGVWIVSKYIDSKGNNNMGSASVYRGPRFKY